MSDLLSLKGVGDSTLKKLQDNGIHSILSLLETYPTKYDTHKLTPIGQAKVGVEVRIRGIIHTEPKVVYIRRKLTKMMVSIESDGVIFLLSIFNREFLKSTLYIGLEVVVTGKFNERFQNFQASDMVHAKNFTEGIIPRYGLQDVSDKIIRKLMKEALSNASGLVKESIPENLLQHRSVLSINELLKKIHYPKNDEDIRLSVLRIKYEELLDFALRMALMKKMLQRIFRKAKHYDITKVKQFIHSLPYELTDDQKNATNEIFIDLKKDHQMNRLLQGDVGSGKTICAMIAAYAVYTCKEQTAIMAPTEILAYQHFESFSKFLTPFGVRVAFLSSSVIGEKRKRIYQELEKGEIDIICGTHALIQKDISFHSLGFVCIDEQHRFGVEQRKILRQKGYLPDCLFLSATPIPRTLAMTLFQDMDVSSIKMKPQGRKEIQTKVSSYEEINQVFLQVDKELQKGRQAYFIVPLINESLTSSKISLDEMKNIIENSVLNKYKTGYLHGKMKSEEKASVMNQFYENQVQVLVSTTVVEVGLNVQNATIMVIMNAMQFGLSQLHQLRGRVGRNHFQSYCYLIVDTDYDEENRLTILEQSNDGFAISEKDLEMRGPGEVFGEEQTGLPKFKMANIIEDKELLQQALEDANWVMDSKDSLSIAKRNQIIKRIDSYHFD